MIGDCAQRGYIAAARGIGVDEGQSGRYSLHGKLHVFAKSVAHGACGSACRRGRDECMRDMTGLFYFLNGVGGT